VSESGCAILLCDGIEAMKQLYRELFPLEVRGESGTGLSFRAEAVLFSDEPESVALAEQPTQLALWQNTPNPLNPATTIRYARPEAGIAYMAVYDVNGRHVRVLVGGPVQVGHHKVAWDGTDDGAWVVRNASSTPVTGSVRFVWSGFRTWSG